MKRILFCILPILFLLTSTAYSQSKKPARPEAVPDEVIVKLKESKTIDSLGTYGAKAKKITRGKSKHFKKKGLGRLYLLKVKDRKKALKDLKKNANVEYVEPNYIVSIGLFPNDPEFLKLYGLYNTGQTGGTAYADIDVTSAWDIHTGSTEVLVAVIDTGVDYDHEDLLPNMWSNPGEKPNNGIDDDGNGFVDDVYGWDFYNNDNDPFDDHGHGTHCAGTIGAVGNNSLGVAGVNWNVQIMPLKFLGASGSGTTAGAVSAIEYATLMNVDIMSNSWGGGGYSISLKDAISAANSAGVLFVAAAGNSGSDNDVTPHYPSSYEVPNVVAVAATDHNDLKASFSCYGTESVDLGAPGASIYSTVPLGSCSLCNSTGYRYLSGTSMATPHVSGVAALIKAQFPELKSDGLKSRLLGSVEKISAMEGITVTGGRLNAYASLVVDTVTPQAILDLATGNPTLSAVTLTWTATGDDGDAGTASSYDIRYSISQITEANWGSATEVIGEPSPNAPGSEETWTVNGLTDSTTYYFGIKAIDDVGNSSELSNVVYDVTRTPVTIYADSMEGGTGGWTSDGLWHLETYRSDSPDTSWGYNTGAPNYNYDAGDNWGVLTSPVIDLSACTSAQLKFNYYYETETTGTTWDKRWVQIGVDGVFYDIAQLAGDTMSVWNTYNLDISSYVGNPNVQVRFFFDTTDNIYNVYEGWYIDDVAVVGEMPNTPPVADAKGPYNGTVGSPVTFDGSESSDADGDALTYVWGFGDGSSGTGVNPPHTYATEGTYTVTLTVNDSKVDSQPALTSVVITKPNTLPVADVKGPYTGTVGSPVAFDGSGSSDADGDALTYVWGFGDGSSGTGVNPTHIYATEGTYTITLTVNDGNIDSQPAVTSAEIVTTDVVSIIKAKYMAGKGKLVVEAISTKGGQAVLTVEGFGTMDYNTKKDKYSLKVTAAASPGTVTVNSSFGSTTTQSVVVKGGGKNNKK